MIYNKYAVDLDCVVQFDRDVLLECTRDEDFTVEFSCCITV